MKGSVIGRPYARALFQLGVEGGSASGIAEELDLLTDEILGAPELERVLFTPTHPRSERAEVMVAICERLETSDEIRGFGLLLVNANRAAFLPEVRDALRELLGPLPVVQVLPGVPRPPRRLAERDVEDDRLHHRRGDAVRRDAEQGDREQPQQVLQPLHPEPHGAQRRPLPERAPRARPVPRDVRVDRVAVRVRRAQPPLPHVLLEPAHDMEVHERDLQKRA